MWEEANTMRLIVNKIFLLFIFSNDKFGTIKSNKFLHSINTVHLQCGLPVKFVAICVALSRLVLSYCFIVQFRIFKLEMRPKLEIQHRYIFSERTSRSSLRTRRIYTFKHFFRSVHRSEPFRGSVVRKSRNEKVAII